jgi:hypothetical protein
MGGILLVRDPCWHLHEAALPGLGRALRQLFETAEGNLQGR